jgi:hypothetical protein
MNLHSEIMSGPLVLRPLSKGSWNSSANYIPAEISHEIGKLRTKWFGKYEK